MGRFIGKNLIDLAKEERRDRLLGQITLIVVIGIIFLFLFLKTQVFLAITVQGSSMENTLNSGDFLFANRQRTAKRGDIVVVYDQNVNPEPIIKRVVAVGGDTIWTENGFVYLKTTDSEGNAVTERLDEYYVKTQGVTNMHEQVTVPEGFVFVLGDNRQVSSDSRAFGVVNSNSIIGVVPQWSINIKDSGFVNWYKRALAN